MPGSPSIRICPLGSLAFHPQFSSASLSSFDFRPLVGCSGSRGVLGTPCLLRCCSMRVGFVGFVGCVSLVRWMCIYHFFPTSPTHARVVLYVPGSVLPWVGGFHVDLGFLAQQDQILLGPRTHRVGWIGGGGGEDVGSPIFFFYPGWGFHRVHLWIDGWQMKTRSIVSRSWNHRFRFFLYACQPCMVSSSSSTTTLDGSHRSKITDGSHPIPSHRSHPRKQGRVRNNHTTRCLGLVVLGCMARWHGHRDRRTIHPWLSLQTTLPFRFRFLWFCFFFFCFFVCGSMGKGQGRVEQHTHTHTIARWKRRWTTATTTTAHHHPSPQPLPHRSIVGKTHVDTSTYDRTYHHEVEKNTPWHPNPWKMHACGCAMDPRNKKHTGRYVLHADPTKCTRNKRSRRTKRRRKEKHVEHKPCHSTHAKPNVDGWNGAGLHACAKPNSGRTRRRGSDAQHETRRGYHACERPRHETTRERHGGIDAHAWTSWKKETEPEKETRRTNVRNHIVAQTRERRG